MARSFVRHGARRRPPRAPRRHGRCSTRSASRSPARPSRPRASSQRVVDAGRGRGPCRVLGTAPARIAADAALANGTAAHALDFDDMCFVSLAHPSAPLVAAALAAAELVGASRPRAARRLRRRLRDRRAAGPRDEPAALPARLALHVDARHDRRGRRRIAAARARRGRDRSRARDRGVGSVGPQRELRHDGEAAARGSGGAQRRPGGAAGAGRDDRERRGDRRCAGISRGDGQRARSARSTRSSPISARAGKSSTPASPSSCIRRAPATHPTLDALLDLRRQRPASPADDVEAIDVGVDPITPTMLIYDRPAERARGEVQHAVLRRGRRVVDGRVGIDTFDAAHASRPGRSSPCRRASAMSVDPTLDAVGAAADAGARHGPAARRPRPRPAARQRCARLSRAAGQRRRAGAAKFLSCATRALRRRRPRSRRSSLCARSKRAPTCASADRARSARTEIAWRLISTSRAGGMTAVAMRLHRRRDADAGAGAERFAVPRLDAVALADYDPRRSRAPRARRWWR